MSGLLPPRDGTRVMWAGGPAQRARIFRAARAVGRSVSVGYRPGGQLEVRDVTRMDLTIVEHGEWVTFLDGGREHFTPARPLIAVA